MATPILGIPQISPTQNNKTTTMNDMSLAIENATQAQSVINLNTGTVALTQAQFVGAAMFVGQSHTAQATLTVPATPRVFGVRNASTAYPIVVGGTTGFSVTVAAGAAAEIQSDGTNCFQLASGGPGPTGAQGPPGAISTIVAGPGLAGGTITDSNGTIALAPVGAGHLLANTGTAAAAPVDTPLSDVLDLAFGSAIGDLLYRGATGWQTLAAGPPGNFLQMTATGVAWAGAVGVSEIVAGPGLNGGTITGAGTLSADWQLGLVTAASTNFNINDGTISLAGVEQTANKGEANGYAGLDATGKVPAAQLPAISGSLAGDSDVAFSSPQTGDRIRFNGTTWVNGREPYVVAGFVPGTLAANQVLLVHKFAQAVSLPANFGTTNSGETSYSDALVNATSAVAIAVNKCPAGTDPTVASNWTQIGTITYAAGGHSGAFATSGAAAVSFAAGDKIQAVGPGTADATLANLAITLAGDR